MGTLLNHSSPRVVKFSGGRSSGMMLMKLLKDNCLTPERGDVIVFNNTSAEHPATYEFTRKVKHLAESKYGIPFFWVEFQTYEDAHRHHWTRKSTYRLVNDQPYSEENKSGYRYKGEVFEELLSHKGYLPNIMSRICTQSMKIFTTNAFLSDWWAQKPGIERLGHFGSKPRMTNTEIVGIHKRSNGSTPDDVLFKKREFVRNCSPVREAQVWQDFTGVDICINNGTLQDSTLGDQVQLYGDWALDYISYLGIRFDERHRLEKIKDRINNAENKKTQSLFNQPHNEIICAPLVDQHITKEQVIGFWHKQKFNLMLPDNGLFSNCVYCPLKGRAKLIQIAQEELQSKQHSDTPASINWWINIEEKYSRDLAAEQREITSKQAVTHIGFFGAVNQWVYQNIQSKAEQGIALDDEILEIDSSIPCHCTD